MRLEISRWMNGFSGECRHSFVNLCPEEEKLHPIGASLVKQGFRLSGARLDGSASAAENLIKRKKNQSQNPTIERLGVARTSLISGFFARFRSGPASVLRVGARGRSQGCGTRLM